MSVSKILVNYDEFKRLKEIETKYNDITETKKNNSEKNNSEQEGSGVNPLIQLEKTVMLNDNKLNLPSTQKVTDPITTPALATESDSEPSVKATESDSEPSVKVTEPKKGEGITEEICPPNWWYIGP